MADYASLKVPELKKLLGERGLTQTGNKADLIVRLQENDAASKDSKVKGSTEDEIDWDDDQPAAPESAAPAAAAAPEATPAEPTPAAAAPAATQEPTAETATSSDATVVASTEEADKGGEDDAAAAAEAEEAPAAAPGLSQHLAATDVDAEAKKRAARAARFGIVAEDNDATKKAERAARFGVDSSATIVKGLDAALPDRPRKRGRGGAGDNEERGDGHRGGNKRATPDRRNGGGNNGNRQRGNGGGGGGGGRQRGGPRHNNDNGPKRPSGIINDPVERKKAEERAKRFA